MTQTPPSTSPTLTDVLQDAVRRLVVEGRERILRAADDSRTVMRVRTLQRERDAVLLRMGRTAWRLAQAGEVDHPALLKAMAHVDELEARIRDEEASTLPTPSSDGEE